MHIKNFGKDFYEIQKRQWRNSLFIFIILILFYLFSLGFIAGIFFLGFGFLFTGDSVFSLSSLTKFFLYVFAFAFIMAVIHFIDARKFGANFILRRLGARMPDLNDRYHKQFVNTVDEIRLAAGLPKVDTFVFPEFSINSMALMLWNGTPAVLVTEGLLADFTRDEISAAVAHELAHIIRGDAFYMTLVCSLANFIERIRSAMEPQEEETMGTQTQRVGGPLLMYLAATLSLLVMRMLSTLISRQREILADAVGVELSRNPRALARAIYRAHTKNSFIGDFNQTYSPLFIVPPESIGPSDGATAKIFNTHPPIMQRIRILTDMLGTRPKEIFDEIKEIHEEREKARFIIHSPDESLSARKVSPPDFKEPEKVWTIHTPRKGWTGPYSLEDMLFLRFFTPRIRIRNIQEHIEAPAMEFPQVRIALQNLGKQKPINPERHNRCPRCGILLRQEFYEGVSILICPQCQGKLVNISTMERILARREVGFSKALIEKARTFYDKFIWNPKLRKRIHAQKNRPLTCPACGGRMIARPYNYQYVVPVDKCYACSRIWFDKDELEILQILTEPECFTKNAESI
ncbi:MAG: M48 family metalloprotease [Candidatus Aminicenantes bacterium]|nr:M48 family metalloprotease [Candidatus Aminicenantes bacterium]